MCSLGGSGQGGDDLPDGESARRGGDRDLPWVYVDDVEAVHRRVRERAGEAAAGTLGSPWGLPFFDATDCEGRRWRFAQARPTM